MRGLRSRASRVGSQTGDSYFLKSSGCGPKRWSNRRPSRVLSSEHFDPVIVVAPGSAAPGSLRHGASVTVLDARACTYMCRFGHDAALIALAYSSHVGPVVARRSRGGSSERPSRSRRPKRGRVGSQECAWSTAQNLHRWPNAVADERRAHFRAAHAGKACDCTTGSPTTRRPARTLGWKDGSHS